MYTWENKADTEVWMNGKFDTVEECIKAALEGGEIKPGETIYIGECVDVPIGGVDLSGVLECVEEYVYEQVGEVSEGWNVSTIDDKRRGIYEAYEERMTELVKRYIEEIGETPGFFKVENIKPIEVTY